MVLVVPILLAVLVLSKYVQDAVPGGALATYWHFSVRAEATCRALGYNLVLAFPLLGMGYRLRLMSTNRPN